MSQVIRVATIAIVVAQVAACRGSDPQEGASSCLPGSSRVPGPSCTTSQVALVVDGVADEWAGDPNLDYGLPASCCADGDPGSLHVGRDGDAALGLLMPTVGGPITNGSADYVVLLRRSELDLAKEPGDQQLELHVLPTGVQVFLNGLPIYGVPIDLAFGPQAIELRVPTRAIPFAGSAIIYTEILVDGVPRNAPVFAEKACWDPNAIGDECHLL